MTNEDDKYVSLAHIGYLYGVRVSEVQKWLFYVALWTNYDKPSESALKSELAKQLPDSTYPDYRWHRGRICTLLDSFGYPRVTNTVFGPPD